MVAELSQCFNSNNKTCNNDVDNGVVNNNSLVIPDSSEVNNRNTANSNVPTNNIPTGPNIMDEQFKELKEYTKHLEKEVEEYKKYIEERFNDIDNQQYHVVEGFDNNGNSKDMNDIIIYLMTCIFVLLLVDYIFKMGKNSY
jgi:hypothetical protein